jgi:hypothetical protein
LTKLISSFGYLSGAVKSGCHVTLPDPTSVGVPPPVTAVNCVSLISGVCLGI